MKHRAVFLCLFFCARVFAEEITFFANSMTGIAGNTSDRTTLTGEAFVHTSSVEISADKIEMSGTDFRMVQATGNISGKNLTTHLEFTCGQMTYDRETKIAILRDGVFLTDTENEVTAQAEIIEYNQNTDIAVLQMNITLKQKDNVCTGAYAIYRKKEQLLNLSGNAQIVQGTDSFRAQEILLDMDTQRITLDGRVRGSVTDERKAEEPTTETTKTTGAEAAPENTSATKNASTAENASAADTPTETETDKGEPQ